MFLVLVLTMVRYPSLVSMMEKTGTLVLPTNAVESEEIQTPASREVEELREGWQSYSYQNNLSDTGWTQMSSPTTQHLSALWGSSHNDVFAFGSNGIIIHYDGIKWSEMDSGITNTVRAAWGTDSNNILALASSENPSYESIIWHYDGVEWTVAARLGPYLADLWGSHTDDVYAAGSIDGQELVMHFNGDTWSEIYRGGTGSLSGIWGSSNKDIFAVGKDILHYDGSSWGVMYSNPDPGAYNDVAGSSGSDVYVITNFMRQNLHYDGVEWSPVGGYAEALYEVWVRQNGDAFAVGWDMNVDDPNAPTPVGIIHHRKSSGFGWWETTVITVTNSLGAVWGSNETDDVFVVGGGGTILHYSGKSYSISHIEVTQSIQNEDNGIPLVEGKPTFVRVYMDCYSNESIPDFHAATLWGYGGSGSLGAPLRPHSGSLDQACQYSYEEQRKDPKRTLNFTLPAGWRYGEVTLVIQVSGVTKSETVTFQPAKRLNVIYVPIRHRGDSPNFTRIQTGFLWALRIYPTDRINYTRGSTIAWNRCLQESLLCTRHEVEQSVSRLLNELTTQYRLSGAYVYGWLPEDTYPGGKSIPRWRGGIAAFGVDHPTEGQRVFAHEVAHLLGRRHTNSASCHPEVIDLKSDWPYTSTNSLIQNYGLDGYGFGWMVSSPNVVKNPTITYDYMSYCGWLGDGTIWTSGWTYERLFSEFFGNQNTTWNRNVTITSQPYVIASGLVYTDDTATFDPMWVVTSAVSPDNPPIGTQYCLEAQANDSTVLADHCFDLPFENYETGEATSVDGFNIMLPYTAEIGRIVLKRGTSELVAQLASAHSPTVTILSPTSEDSWAASSTYTVTWEGYDPDDDPLTYSVFYSSNGTNWMPLGTTVTETHKVVNASELPGSVGAQVRVMVSDGVNTAKSESEPFTVGSKGPEVSILSPSESLSVTLGTALWLHGQAYDLEDGFLEKTSLLWSSSRDGELGTGTELLPSLSLGQHVLTLTATDSENNTATTSVNVTIVTGDGYTHQVYLPLTLRN